MAKYIEGNMVLFYHRASSSNRLKGMIQAVLPSGDDVNPNHYNILCEELQCELLVSESDIIDIAF